LVDLDSLFYPKHAIAIIGVSSLPIKGATSTLYALRKVNFPNPIFNINKHRTKVIFNETAYPSLLDLPSDIEIDYIVVGVPAEDVPAVIEAAAQRHVKFATIFTSGFSELETEQGQQLEQTILKIAKNGPRLIGPNCLGVFCRESRLTVTEIFELIEKKGHVAFISQSGGHTGTFFNIAEHRGFPLNKAVSIGNQCDLTIQDFIEYFANDERISVIASYIERVKNPTQFLEILSEAAQKKPTILWKGGRTEVGVVAASSHTGAITSSYDIFQNAILQHGGILAESLEELADLTLGALCLAKKKLGKRVGLLVPGGGSCVEIADEAAKNGLNVPELTWKTRDAIQEIIQEVNTNTRNPIDMGVLGWIPNIFGKALSYLAHEPKIDVIIFYLMAERFPSMIQRINDRRLVKSFMRYIKMVIQSSKKPFVCILPNLIVTDIVITKIRQEIVDALKELHIPYFPSMERAGNVIKKLVDYQNRTS